MAGYTSCYQYDISDGALELQNVSLAEGMLSHVYLCPGGICAVAASSQSPQKLYEGLRNALGTAECLTLYLEDSGRYDAFSRSVQPLPEGSVQRDREISQVLYETPDTLRIFTPERIARLRDALVQADAHNRGYYRDADGVLYVERHGHFVRASHHDPDRLWNLTLFGGVFGLHRFAVGKVGSGLLYLVTCGLFLVGWLLDIVQLLLGIQKDRRGAVILPLQNKRRCLLRLLPGLAVGAVFFLLYAGLFTGATGALADPASSGLADSLADTLLNLFPELTESP